MYRSDIKSGVASNEKINAADPSIVAASFPLLLAAKQNVQVCYYTFNSLIGSADLGCLSLLATHVGFCSEMAISDQSSHICCTSLVSSPSFLPTEGILLPLRGLNLQVCVLGH